MREVVLLHGGRKESLEFRYRYDESDHNHVCTKELTMSIKRAVQTSTLILLLLVSCRKSSWASSLAAPPGRVMGRHCHCYAKWVTIFA